MESKNKKRALLAASMAGLMLAAGAGFSPAAHAEEDVKCYGVNKCKGAGACGGKNGCAGQNACKGHGFVKVSKEACLAIEGGSLTPKE